LILALKGVGDKAADIEDATDEVSTKLMNVKRKSGKKNMGHA
jgi:hypothetical protein